MLFVLARNLFRSRPGRALIALRDNPIGAEVSGVNLAHYKVIAFGLSSAYAGIAGSLLMFRSDIASGSSYSLNRSIALITGLVLGGLATIVGPVIGGLIIVWLPRLIEDRIHGSDPRDKAWSTIVVRRVADRHHVRLSGRLGEPGAHDSVEVRGDPTSDPRAARSRAGGARN